LLPCDGRACDEQRESQESGSSLHHYLDACRNGAVAEKRVC
jgi:hypothetical protein